MAVSNKLSVESFLDISFQFTVCLAFKYHVMCLLYSCRTEVRPTKRLPNATSSPASFMYVQCRLNLIYQILSLSN